MTPSWVSPEPTCAPPHNLWRLPFLLPILTTALPLSNVDLVLSSDCLSRTDGEMDLAVGWCLQSRPYLDPPERSKYGRLWRDQPTANVTAAQRVTVVMPTGRPASNPL